MSEGRRIGRTSLAGVASVGVVVGHWLTYMFAVPATSERAHLLAASGHGYWPGAVKIAVVLGVSAVGALLAGALSDRLRDRSSVPQSPLRLATPLAAMQLAAFVAMEVVERLLAGAPVAGMFAHHLLLIGLAVQVLLAGAGALVLWWLGRAATRAILPAGPIVVGRPRRVASLVFPAWAAPRAVVVAAPGPRGPPSATR